MKAQCEHSNTGICDICWNYEIRIAKLSVDNGYQQRKRLSAQQKCLLKALERIVDIGNIPELDENPIGQIDYAIKIAEEAIVEYKKEVLNGKEHIG